MYALFALFLAQQNSPKIKLVKSLIIANWVWSVISVFLLLFYFAVASLLGKLFLILQVFFDGGLAYFEAKASKKSK